MGGRLFSHLDDGRLIWLDGVAGLGDQVAVHQIQVKKRSAQGKIKKVLSEEEQSVVSIGASHYVENYKKYKQIMNSDENK